jgi:hypothetical protein
MTFEPNNLGRPVYGAELNLEHPLCPSDSYCLLQRWHGLGYHSTYMCFYNFCGTI